MIAKLQNCKLFGEGSFSVCCIVLSPLTALNADFSGYYFNLRNKFSKYFVDRFDIFLHQVTETSEEYEMKNQLEEQLRSIMDKYKYKRRQIRELQEDLQVCSNSLNCSKLKCLIVL